MRVGHSVSVCTSHKDKNLPSTVAKYDFSMGTMSLGATLDVNNRSVKMFHSKLRLSDVDSLAIGVFPLPSLTYSRASSVDRRATISISASRLPVRAAPSASTASKPKPATASGVPASAKKPKQSRSATAFGSDGGEGQADANADPGALSAASPHHPQAPHAHTHSSQSPLPASRWVVESLSWSLPLRRTLSVSTTYNLRKKNWDVGATSNFENWLTLSPSVNSADGLPKFSASATLSPTNTMHVKFCTKQKRTSLSWARADSKQPGTQGRGSWQLSLQIPFRPSSRGDFSVSLARHSSWQHEIEALALPVIYNAPKLPNPLSLSFPDVSQIPTPSVVVSALTPKVASVLHRLARSIPRDLVPQSPCVRNRTASATPQSQLLQHRPSDATAKPADAAGMRSSRLRLRRTLQTAGL
eukprot:Rmarinus@m.27803